MIFTGKRELGRRLTVRKSASVLLVGLAGSEELRFVDRSKSLRT